MSPLVILATLFFLVAATLLAIAELLRTRLWQRFFVHAAIVVVATLVLSLSVGFPSTSTRQAFGGGHSLELTIGLMFVGVILGMVARYLFWLRRAAFSWLDFVRPLVVSPIVLLPLIGTLENGGLDSVQLASVVILAFQNGFFWQQVLRDAEPTSA
jgi:H+/Cl- antiporter ClcA